MTVALHRAFDWRGPDRIVLVHGFTQTLRSWDRLAALLSETFQVVRVDLPGHGGSVEVDLSFEDTAAALGEAGGTATYVGYSLGGRLCLRLAVDRPDIVQSLVLVGASPGLADAGERAERRAEDEVLAAEVERVGTAAFLERWLAQPLFAGLTPDPDDIDARLANSPAGLARALRRLGTGVQEPLWDRLGDLKMPVLAITGQADAKFSRLADEIAGAIGVNAQAVAVAGAGHAAHLERPASFHRLLTAFLLLHSSTR
ncbi:MAG TPA: alpha/beta fold hydrolase [Acidimicrobiales bacterium]|nr:alpha/beta fold hydrolase [Acidimicrobiales bacterium]